MTPAAQPAPAVYKWTGPTGVNFTQVRSPRGTYYHEETPEPVRRILDEAMNTDRRLRVFTGDTKTGRCWNEEWGTIGTVSRSMGSIAIPMLVATRRSMSAPALLDACIIGIQSSPCLWQYRHPSLDLGVWTTDAAVSEGYAEAAYCNGDLHAQFRKAGQAQRYCQFMRGERWSK